MRSLFPFRSWDCNDSFFARIGGAILVQQRGFPLGMLFLLIAFCAVLASLLTIVIQAVREGVGTESAILSSIAAGLVAALIGIVLGAHQFRRFQGSCLGALSGLMIGAVAGPLVALNASQFGSAVTVCTGGALILLGIAAVIRWSSRASVSLVTPFASDATEGDIVSAEVIANEAPHEDSRDSRPSAGGWDG